MLLSSPPTPLCLSQFCCVMGLCLFNELMSCFQRSNTLYNTHIPSSAKANSIGFEKRRVDSVEKKTDEGKGGVIAEHSHLGGKKG